MKKNTPLSKTLDDNPRLANKVRLIAIKGSRPDPSHSSRDAVDGHRLDELNRLANTPPFCTTHRVKKNDTL